MISLLLRGLIVGFAIAASPGPIFFLCLRRTLAQGWIRGLVSGLGVATGDGTYAALAAFGVGAITSVAVAQRAWMALIGGVALLLLGIRTLLSRSAGASADSPPTVGNLAAAYLSTLGLTVTNPATILSFAAVFAGLGLATTHGDGAGLALVVGVLVGSAVWWIVLASVAAVARTRITPAVTTGIGIFSGLAIAAFGLLAIGSAVRGYR